MSCVGQAKIRELPVIFGVLLREYALHKANRFAPYITIPPAVGRTQERSEQSAANGAKSQGVLLREYALHKANRFALYITITPAVGRTQERSKQSADSSALASRAGVLLRECALRLFCGSPEVQPCCA